MKKQEAKKMIGKAFKRKNADNYIQLQAVNDDCTVTVKIYGVYTAGRGRSQVISLDSFFNQI